MVDLCSGEVAQRMIALRVETKEGLIIANVFNYVVWVREFPDWRGALIGDDDVGVVADYCRCRTGSGRGALVSGHRRF
jgi:hypothetical protein